MKCFEAKWIWPTSMWQAGAHVLFRKDVTFEQSPGDLTLSMSAGTFAKLYINGREVHQTTSLSCCRTSLYWKLRSFNQSFL